MIPKENSEPIITYQDFSSLCYFCLGQNLRPQSFTPFREDEDDLLGKFSDDMAQKNREVIKHTHIPTYTSQKFNIDTKKRPCLKGVTFSKPRFWVSMLVLGEVSRFINIRGFRAGGTLGYCNFFAKSSSEDQETFLKLCENREEPRKAKVEIVLRHSAS